jgi:hypothetical protein
VDPPELAALAERFRRFGIEVLYDGVSPLYFELCARVADDPAVLEPMRGTPEKSPMVFLAAVHDELLRDPEHALARHYPDVGGTPGPALWEAFTAFCADRAERLRTTLETRRTQTNEIARCGGLLPCFAEVADGRPLALIEVGASAGLNLLWDRYRYDYGAVQVGDPDAPLTLGCALLGPQIPPLDPPEVVWRAGIDLDPVDLGNPEHVRWLRACVWPDQPERRARLDAALLVARDAQPPIHRGDALELLPDLIEQAPADALVCLFHTAALAYFTREQVAELHVVLAGVEREVTWVGGEAPGVLVGDRRSPGERLDFALAVGRPGALELRGRMGHHGGWLEWLGT